MNSASPAFFATYLITIVPILGMLAMTSPVVGLVTGMVAALSASHQVPLI
jgi:hypothetical protein